MAKDVLGNVMHLGDKIVFNNMVYTIKDIQENRVLGGRQLSQSKGMVIKIPDTITLEIELPFEADKPFNGYVPRTPPETGSGEA